MSPDVVVLNKPISVGSWCTGGCGEGYCLDDGWWGWISWGPSSHHGVASDGNASGNVVPAHSHTRKEPASTHTHKPHTHTRAHTHTRRCAATIGVLTDAVVSTAANCTGVMSEERVCSTAGINIHPKAASPGEGIAGGADAIIPAIYVDTLASAFKGVARYNPCGGWCMRGSCRVGGARYNVAEAK